MGHSLFGGDRFSHFMMQWMWKQWVQLPHTSGQSSPGSEQSGQVFSNAMRQIPQFSSLAVHRHDATPTHDLMVTRILTVSYEQYRHQHSLTPSHSLLLLSTAFSRPPLFSPRRGDTKTTLCSTLDLTETSPEDTNQTINRQANEIILRRKRKKDRVWKWRGKGVRTCL